MVIHSSLLAGPDRLEIQSKGDSPQGRFQEGCYCAKEGSRTEGSAQEDDANDTEAYEEAAKTRLR